MWCSATCCCFVNLYISCKLLQYIAVVIHCVWFLPFKIAVNDWTTVAPDWVCSSESPVWFLQWYPPVNSIGDHESPQMLSCWCCDAMLEGCAKLPTLWRHIFITIFFCSASLHNVACSWLVICDHVIILAVAYLVYYYCHNSVLFITIFRATVSFAASLPALQMQKKKRKCICILTNSRIKCSYPSINAYKYTLSLV